jgi:hypothetical protein
VLVGISGFEAIEKTIKKADAELLENLRLFAERITLFRITRVKKKGPELARFATILLQAGKISEDPGASSSSYEEISSFESLANERLSPADISGLFSAMVDALESLDGKQLYYILDKLRNEPL